MNNFMILAKEFVANESVVVDLKSTGLENRLDSLVFQNQSGESAQFLWQYHDAAKTGYFKEMNNDLGVKVAHYDGFLTVTNGGGRQYLKAELKV
ncbi:hypothetical protein [Chryseobacterium sp. SIMBA_028]|uniref:hypothetical protein n=1 Tax=Chryseobacterium sp. SIMBA_028 TaxID=3085771 RepID=UPI0039788989